MSHVLLTGGAGFIGSHVADALLEGGHDVRVLDWLHPAAHAGRTRPADLPDAVEFVAGDVRDGATVAAALAGVDHVCHQAAMVGLGTDILDIADYVAHNDLGTAVLLRELARSRFAGRLVQASSMVVYGEGRYACTEHGDVRPPARTPADLDAGRFDPPCPRCAAPLVPQAIPEDAPLDPRNVYAATKLQQEHLATAFSRETGIPVVSLRYHNVYGPRMPRDTPYAGVASIFVSALNAGRAPQVYEDGGQLRDFVHVRDVARANVLALTADAAPAGAFNVCSGTPRSVGEMARALHAAGFGAVPPPQTTGAYRLGDVRHVFAAPDRAAAGLGFVAREDFGAGMAEFAAAPLRGTS
ncbi:dTDP-L-rhamnose 4-epimerase [Paraconexibacter sp. AEG42_29]|uniref:dTDP-L-rhamnose 4-epimerase n=1 Tax=Paraconexibacter sp. AEG42_29 TaxID=2997339 RepID=A0AAU7AZ05_9ACTN